eukprot:CAMPEP_0185550170 /NCGR_PEP_ID=MMETSP1381-20130426/19786_1 /TAXON_ID=298111 /ORGANISM="Pavlova sp., Strain CCMP459" /LENGTH=171 /DNA_ID=CAMNT_0028162941 /DNA_START=28 /DNA_END=543 /DNA_ORIENTATION=-
MTRCLSLISSMLFLASTHAYFLAPKALPAQLLGSGARLTALRARSASANCHCNRAAVVHMAEDDYSSFIGPLFCLNVCLKVKPERREEFIKCIRANQRGTLTSETLALEYVFGEDESTPNTFHFFEKYLSKEGFEAHTKTPHFAAWEEFAATEPFTAPPVVSFYELDAGDD